ncbi:hypothetical protein D3C71_2003920 [compost metagenome]
MYEEAKRVNEEKAWGIILADAAKHIADALEISYNKNYADTMKSICHYFNEEVSKPSSRASGEFVKEH